MPLLLITTTHDDGLSDMVAGGGGRESGQGCHPHESRPEGHTLCSWRHGRQVCLQPLFVPSYLFSACTAFP